MLRVRKQGTLLYALALPLVFSPFMLQSPLRRFHIEPGEAAFFSMGCFYILFILYCAASLRCPRCRLRLFSVKAKSEWDSKFKSEALCPRCGLRVNQIL